MNKKIFAIIFSALLLCSCGNGNAEEQPETASESVTSASETKVTTTSAETTSEAVSEETEIAAEVSAAEEKTPITRDFFNDDVVFEEVMLPVKVTYYINGAVDDVIAYEYDAAGNQTVYDGYTKKYDYNPDGTYNSVTLLFTDGEEEVTRFDENGYCIERTYSGNTTNYEYEFDEAGHLIRKTEIRGNQKGSFEYTYDENGRLYEIAYGNSRFRHEYGDGVEKIYYLPDSSKEEMLLEIIEKDKNGNIIKETIYKEGTSAVGYGEIIYEYEYEYKYDNLNRLVYKKSIYPEHFGSVTENIEYLYDDNGRLVKELITIENENGENELTYRTMEYLYNDDNRSMISQYHRYTNGVIDETEYAMIPKIKTNIEYKEFDEVEP